MDKRNVWHSVLFFFFLIHCQDLEIEKFQIKSVFPASCEKADLGTAGLCFLMVVSGWQGEGSFLHLTGLVL